MHKLLVILITFLISLGLFAEDSATSDASKQKLQSETDMVSTEDEENDPNTLSAEDLKFEQRDLSNYGANSVPEGLVQLGRESDYFSPYVFIVDKNDRVLSIWEETAAGIRKVAAYTADIGKNTSDKKILGDKATPEGIYFMLEKYEGDVLDYSRYGSRAFTLDYPNFYDRRERKTGSGIWLHAVPDTISLRRGSRGCVVVRDDIIKNLHPYYKSGFTPVIIQNKVKMRTQSEAKTLRKDLNQLVENWRQSWVSGNIDSYMNHYHSEFKALGMNKNKWRTYKSDLKTRYDKISVQLSRPVIYEHKNEVIVRFIQKYASNEYSDFGQKTLFLKKENGSYKIMGEQWKKDSSRLALDELKGRSMVSVCQNLIQCGSDVLPN
jgi:murein L,D-transpeptidase YafK